MEVKLEGRNTTVEIILLRVFANESEVGSKAFMLKERISLGRDPYTDIFLEDPTVSRLHAVIDRQDHGFVLRDRSSNGTVVNGRSTTIHTLQGGDEIRIGRYVIRIEMHDDTASSFYEQAQAEGWTTDDERTMRRSECA